MRCVVLKTNKSDYPRKKILPCLQYGNTHVALTSVVALILILPPFFVHDFITMFYFHALFH